jgi:tetratricopeptide (TPR) repeat protein/predicted Ser/Thr protein kinase
MLCPKCGAPNPQGALTCSKCFQDLLGADSVSDAPTLDVNPQPAGDLEAAEPKSRGQLGTDSTMLSPGAELGRRYYVVKPLGKGGMGAVYLARDRELRRDVALKIIATELADNPADLERFRREVHLSSLVTHKNVLRVYDLGESRGIKFLTMQYVEGGDLAHLLNREGRPTLARALDIFRQLCEGLAAAHEKGVLHRDLKPQNILVDAGGTVYVTDFGLATSLNLTGMTQTGGLLGTPHYMSPEQVKGEPADARTDVFALGVILYEMLTGQKPYSGNSAYEVMMQRIQRPPKPACELNPEIPSYLRKILDRCLAADKNLRYSSVKEILADLDSAQPRTSLLYTVRRKRLLRPLVAAVTALVMAGAGWSLYRSGRLPAFFRKTSAGIENVPLVGVVPFANRTGDRNFDWYGEGLARLVADSLGQSRHVRIVSEDRIEVLRSTAGNDAPLAPSAAANGIGFLLTGEIFSGPGGLTLSTRLSETKTGREVASRRIDGLSQKNLIGASDQITMAAKKGLNIPPTEGVDTYAADFATKNTEAYELYVKGLRAFSNYNYQEAEQQFAAALKKAPDYSMALYRLAELHAATGQTQEALAEIRQAAAESSRLSDREARYVRAAEARYSRRNDDAIKQYQEMIERYPYEIEPREALAWIYLDTGEYNKAIEQANIIARIEPGSQTPWSVLGTAHLGLKDFNQAVLELRHYVELEPGSANGHHLLGDSYRSQGELELAAEEYRKALQADPAFHFSTVSLAVVEALRGRQVESEQLLSSLVADPRALPRHRIDAAFELASLLRMEGHFREAAVVLEKLQAPIAAEKVREAMALSVRGTCLMEVGEQSRAGQLIQQAVQRSPGVPTRYQFARGLWELKQKRPEAVEQTAARILENALPQGNPDRTEEKAAAYLRGLVLLSQGKAADASEELSKSVALSGYEYAIYRLGLARAYLAARRFPEAMANAKQASEDANLVEPRLDLELDRIRASLVLAEVEAAMGRKSEAAAQARKFLAAWAHADSNLPDLAEARRLLSPGK